ncbi:MAG: hypothetical protein RLQ25_04095 [Alphaproteobacteria bacterium]
MNHHRFAALVIAAIACLVLLPANPAPAAASTEPAVRVGVHDGFGRIVVDWGRPVVYEAAITDQALAVHFADPVGDIALAAVPRGLVDYVASADVSDDGLTVTFRLKRDYQLRQFRLGHALVFDLYAVDAMAEAAATLARMATAADATDQPAAGQAATATPVETSPPPVTVRVGEHSAFFRLVFDWPQPVDAVVSRAGPDVTVTFSHPGVLATDRLAEELPPFVTLGQVDAQGSGVRARFAIPAASDLRHFSHNNSFVLDIMRPPMSPPEETPALAQAGVDTAAADGVVAQDTEAPAEPQPTSLLAAAEAVATPPPAAGPSDGLPIVPVGVRQSGDAVTLSFGWTQSVAAAVFRRDGFIWIVFDRAADLDLQALEQAGGVAGRAQRVEGADAAALRLPAPGLWPTVSRDGLVWTVEVLPEWRPPQFPLDFTIVQDGGAPPHLFAAIGQVGRIIDLHDPDVGDTLRIAPVTPLGYGVESERQFPQLTLLASVQGAAVAVVADDVVVSDDGGIHISAADGILVSPVVDRLMDSAPGGGSFYGLFDFARWRRDDLGGFEAARHTLMQAAVAAGGLAVRGAGTGVGEGDEARNLARLDLAQLLFAHGRSREAMGLLAVVGESDPERLRQPSFRALTGAAAWLAGDMDRAAADLLVSSLESDPHAAPWRAAVLAARGEPVAALAVFGKGQQYLLDYPAPYSAALTMAMVEAALESNDGLAARRLLDDLDLIPASDAGAGRRALLAAQTALALGDTASALADLDGLAETGDRFVRSRAVMALTEARRASGEITLDQAIEALEAVRFTWRGDRFEFRIMRELGESYIAVGRTRDGLATLRKAVEAYPDHPAVAAVADTMRAAFAEAFLSSDVRLSPVRAIALFDEFRELTPGGSDGDRLIQGLADDLVRVDLLHRAGELLAHQVEFRLSGESRARIGARLALVRLLDQKPVQAMQALDQTNMIGLDNDLRLERRRLYARALGEVGSMGEALALLDGDHTAAADRLRVELMWRQGAWGDAARILQGLASAVQPDAPDTALDLDQDSASLVLNLAVAQALAEDERALAATAARFAVAMERTFYADEFRLVIGGQGRDVVLSRTIAQQIAEVGDFEAFLAGYRERLQGTDLSAIN